MSNEEKKEPVIASYELTAAHKEEDDISESEVNDMINESEEDARPANESRLATHPFLHFLYQNLLWLVICIVIFIICIPHIFYKRQNFHILIHYNKKIQGKHYLSLVFPGLIISEKFLILLQDLPMHHPELMQCMFYQY